MKLQFLLMVVLCAILTASISADNYQKQGTWKLVCVWGTKLAPEHFTNNCELITFKGDSVYSSTNGTTTFRGTEQEMITKYYNGCTLVVVNDTLRFSRTYECCDIPFQWDFVKYCESSLKMDGTWRWMETIGGESGSMRTESNYYKIIKINNDSVTTFVNNSLVCADTRNHFFDTTYNQQSWLIVNDTLMSYQLPQCCDIPYLSKWISWVGGETSIRKAQKNFVTGSMKMKSQAIYDFRGRKISGCKPFCNGIFLKQTNMSTLSVINNVHFK